MLSILPGQLASLCGQVNHVASCGAHSGGKTKPALAGGVSNIFIEEIKSILKFSIKSYNAS
jgi:hypothetical protein